MHFKLFATVASDIKLSRLTGKGPGNDFDSCENNESIRTTSVERYMTETANLGVIISSVQEEGFSNNVKVVSQKSCRTERWTVYSQPFQLKKKTTNEPRFLFQYEKRKA